MAEERLVRGRGRGRVRVRVIVRVKVRVRVTDRDTVRIGPRRVRARVSG